MPGRECRLSSLDQPNEREPRKVSSAPPPPAEASSVNPKALASPFAMQRLIAFEMDVQAHIRLRHVDRNAIFHQQN